MVNTHTLPEILAATEIALTDLIGSRQSRPIPAKVRALGPTTNKSDAIAGMFMPIFEGELGDPRFIELAQALRHHTVVLFLGRTRKW
jgi:hypothetical protein